MGYELSERARLVPRSAPAESAFSAHRQRPPLSTFDRARVGDVTCERGSRHGGRRAYPDLRARVAEPAPEIAVGAGNRHVSVAHDEVAGNVDAGAAAGRLDGCA